MVNKTTHWEKKKIQLDCEVYVPKHKEYKSVSRGGGSYGIITVSKEFIGKKFKVILVPEVSNDREESVKSESMLSPEN